MALSVAGLAGGLLTVSLGFEQPNALLLWASIAAAVAAPIAVLAHLTGTRALTPEHKRVWWKEFRSANVVAALSEYLSSTDLDASADRRMIEAERRSGPTKTPTRR